MTAGAERLTDLFRCERFVQLFPRGMSRRACMRRQVERQRDGKGWAPRHPSCAVDCRQGEDTRAALAGVMAEACGKCGSAVIGTDECPTCQEKRAEREPLRQAIERTEVSARLWEKGVVPDVPIGPPPATAPGLGSRPKMPFNFGTSVEALERAAAKARGAARRERSILDEEPEEEELDEDVEADLSEEDDDVDEVSGPRGRGDAGADLGGTATGRPGPGSDRGVVHVPRADAGAAGAVSDAPVVREGPGARHRDVLPAERGPDGGAPQAPRVRHDRERGDRLSRPLIEPARTEAIVAFLPRLEGVERLSPAEQFEVVRIARGMGCKESAAAAGVSHDAIRQRRKNVYRRLGVGSADAVTALLLAEVLGLLDARAPRDAERPLEAQEAPPSLAPSRAETIAAARAREVAAAAKELEERRAKKDEGPSLPRTAAPAEPPERATTSALIGDLTRRLDRELNGKMPDGLPGGSRGSTARLTVPRLTSATSGVMTEKTCRCGCWRPLRKNNTTGWSGYCNPARYAAGERPTRKRGKESEMPRGKRSDGPCPGCGTKSTRCRKDCPLKSGAAPAPVAAPLETRTVPELVEERAMHAAAIAAIDTELHNRRKQIDAAIGRNAA